MEPKKQPKHLEALILMLLDRVEIDDGTVHDVSLLGQDGIRFLFEVALGKVKEATLYQRGNAVFVLGLLKQEKAIEILISLLREENEKFRLLTLSALGRIGGDRARKALRDQLEWGQASLAERSYAIEFLGQIGNKEDIDLLEKLAKQKDVGLLAEKARGAVFDILRRNRPSSPGKPRALPETNPGSIDPMG